MGDKIFDLARPSRVFPGPQLNCDALKYSRDVPGNPASSRPELNWIGAKSPCWKQDGYLLARDSYLDNPNLTGEKKQGEKLWKGHGVSRQFRISFAGKECAYSVFSVRQGQSGSEESDFEPKILDSAADRSQLVDVPAKERR